METVFSNSNNSNAYYLSIGPTGQMSVSAEEPKPSFRKMFRVEKIYVNLEKKTLTVWWGEDDTRTTVTCSDRDDFSIEDGFRAALAKKIYGNYQTYEKFFKNKVVVSGKRTKIEFESIE